MIMFHIIMPVYNAQDYLKEALESIINQTLSFEDNIIIHLIDDASSDNSLAICYEYRDKYPDNITVKHFDQNQGVSSVRNYGLSLCKNEESAIVGFIDCDDYIDESALEKVDKYFKKHSDINLAAMEIHYFGAREGEHKSNWRFEEREVVNIKEDYIFPQFYIGGVFLRNKPLKKLKFDTNMSFWEDAFAINQVLIKEGKYGLVKNAKYFYRQSDGDGSLVNSAWKKKERYTTFLKDGYLRLMRYCRLRKFRVIPYIQFLVAYHLRLFLLESNRDTVLSMVPEEELADFKQRLRKVLKKIDDSVIVRLNTALPIIEAELSIKHNKKVRVSKRFENNDMIFFYGDYEIARLSERNVRVIGILDKEGYEGMLRGRFSTPLYAMKKDDYIFAEHDGQRIESVKYKCKKRFFILDELYRNYKNAGFAIDLPDDWQSFRFGLHTKDGDVMLNECELGDVK